MTYIVLFEDDESHAEMRARHMAAHLAFLEENAASVQAAGPLKDTADAAPAGGLWLVAADSPEAVHALVKSDPFWPTGLRKSYRVLEWTRVFAEGERRI